MPNRFPGKKSAWIGGLVLVTLLVGVLLLWENPSAELLNAPSKAAQRFSFLGSWRTPIRLMWMRLKFRILGPNPTVSIGTEMFEPSDVAALVANLPQNVLSNENLRVWVLSTNQTSILRQHGLAEKKYLNGTRIVTGDRFESHIFVGDSRPLPPGITKQPGCSFDFMPRLHGQTLDLSSFVTLTTLATNHPAGSSTNSYLMLTNLAAGARVQIGNAENVFLLGSDRVKGERIGIIISAKVQTTGR